MRQRLVWMNWLPDPRLGSGGRFQSVEEAEVPRRVWTLLRDFDPANPPALPIIPVHGHNAFAEDYVHDWNVRGGKLNFFTRVMDRSCWILLEFDS